LRIDLGQAVELGINLVFWDRRFISNQTLKFIDFVLVF
jgi:hypothetical protein